ncbi:MAG TPA: ABC transporter permease [Gemmatimonadales bacterium]
MNTIWQDLRYAVRSLRQRPLFTAIVVLTLGLGIGANTAIFSVLDAVVLRPLSYHQPDRLVEILRGGGNTSISFPNLRDLRARARTFSQMATFRYWLFNLSGTDHPQSLLGVYVGDSLFATLQVQPLLGRLFSPGTESPAYPREVVLSYSLWRSRFGSDRQVVGTVATIDGLPTTIVGVLPEAFRFPDLVPASAPLPSRIPDVYLPVSAQLPSDRDNRGDDNYWVLARLAPSVTLKGAAADLARVSATLARDYPADNKHLTLAPVPLQQQITGDVQRPLGILFGAVALVLLIACANVGGLLLARAVERRLEISVRRALGASPARLARQLLTESLVLALLGGAVGVVLAAWGVALLRVVAPATLPRIDEISVDGRILLFALVGSLVTGVLFGLAPILQQRTTGMAGALRDTGRVAGGGASRRLRSWLVVIEVALAVVLLTGAGLLFRSFDLLRNVNPGFDGSRVMTMFTLLPSSRYPGEAQMATFERRALAGLNNMPGVESASAINTLPMTNLGNNTTVDVVGHMAESPADRPDVAYRILGGSYFHTMATPIVSGRDFVIGDSAGAPPVVIINEAAARKLFPGDNPIGHQLIDYNQGGMAPKTIVGVVADVHGISLDSAATPEINTPYQQGAEMMISLAIRTRGNPYLLLPEIRHELATIDPDQAFYAERTMADLVSASLAIRRFDLQLLGGFAGLALILAMVGLYGVIAFSVSQRTREIGIRTALGAERAGIAWLVLREGAWVGGLGVALGVVVSIAATRLMRALLYHVGAADPVTYLAVIASLAVVVLAACYLPARRAARIDPVEALRE